MLISAVHLYFRLKNPSEQKEDSLGRLQTKVQSRRTTWGYSTEAWGVWALGTQGWKPLGLKTPANILPATPSFSYFHWLIRFESRAQKKLASFWELTFLVNYGPFVTPWDSWLPDTRRGIRAPAEDGHGSIMDDEENRGNGWKCRPWKWRPGLSSLSITQKPGQIKRLL